MATLNRIFIVICEGLSEESYLRELNKVLREEGIPISFCPKPSNGGDFSSVITKYKEQKRQNPRTEFLIWVDKDIYKRNDRKNNDKYQSKPTNIPPFLFNIYNFEDILTLHLGSSYLNNWEKICMDKNHFDSPMKSDIYEPLLKEHIFNNYEKGSFPLIDFTLGMIKTAIENNKNTQIRIASDFLTKLEELLQKYL